MARDHNDAEYDLAMQAPPADTRTREQRKWDAHVEAANQIGRKLSAMMCRPWLGEPVDPYGFHHNAGTPAPRAPIYLEAISNLVHDLDRELKALRIMGYRDGDPVPPISAPRIVFSRPIPLAKLDKVGGAS